MDTPRPDNQDEEDDSDKENRKPHHPSHRYHTPLKDHPTSLGPLLDRLTRDIQDLQDLVNEASNSFALTLGILP